MKALRWWKVWGWIPFLLLLAAVTAGVLVTGDRAPTRAEQPPTPVVVEVEPGVWACLQERRAVPCHFGDGGDTFDRARR